MRELTDSIDSRELAEWQAYERVTGPLGAERDDVLTGIVASTVANTASKRRVKPADAMPEWDRREQTWQEQLAVVRTLNRRFGGTTTRKDSDGESR